MIIRYNVNNKIGIIAPTILFKIVLNLGNNNIKLKIIVTPPIVCLDKNKNPNTKPIK